MNARITRGGFQVNFTARQVTAVILALLAGFGAFLRADLRLADLDLRLARIERELGISAPAVTGPGAGSVSIREVAP